MMSMSRPGRWALAFVATISLSGLNVPSGMRFTVSMQHSPRWATDYGASFSVTEVRNASGAGYGFDFPGFDAAHKSKRGITVLWSSHWRSFVAAHAFPFLVLM